MKCVLIGSVKSSQTVLSEMIKIGFPVEMVFSLDEAAAQNVSGYVPIHELAKKNNIPFLQRAVRFFKKHPVLLDKRNRV